MEIEDESACAAKYTLGVGGDATRSSSIEDACPDELGSEPPMDEKDKEPFLHCLFYEWGDFT